jgi:hypothetical protein
MDEARGRSVEASGDLLRDLLERVVLRIDRLGGCLLIQSGKRDCETKIADAAADHLHGVALRCVGSARQGFVADALEACAFRRAGGQSGFAHEDFERIIRVLPAREAAQPFAYI